VAEVVVEGEHEPGVWVADVDPAEVDRIRMQVPTSFQKLDKLYVPYSVREGAEADAKRLRTTL